MHRFRFNSDILSPINSDISLNDTSVISSGSLPSFPNFENETESPIFEANEKDSNVDSVCKRTLKESAAAFDVIVNDVKKTSINTKKEVKFKESYDGLKNSMDELFYKYQHSLSPLSNDTDLEYLNKAEKISETKTDLSPEIPKNSKVLKKTGSTKLKNPSLDLSIKSQKKTECGIKNNKERESNQQSKNFNPIKQSKRNCKQHKVQLENDIAKGSNLVEEFQNSKVSKMVSSSMQTSENFETVGAKEKENLKNFYTQKQRKAAVSKDFSVTESQNLSIEKSIQIAIGMEMDNLRGFILDQNMSLRKDLLKLQETAKKQNEVIGCLYSVIEGLVKENKELISKID